MKKKCIPTKQADGTYKCESCGFHFGDKPHLIKNCTSDTPSFKNDQHQLRRDADRVIRALSKERVTVKSFGEMEGLGDLIEATLQSLGITEERVQEFTGLEECNCTARKKFLNTLLPFWNKLKE